MALAQKKASEDAKRKAAEEIQRREALKKKLEEENRPLAGKNSSAVLKQNHRTVDLEDLYSNMVPENKLLL